MTRRVLALALLVAGVPACKRHEANKGTAPAAAAPAAVAQAQVGGGNGGGGNGGRTHDPNVYVDGEIRGSFTYNELPATVKILERRSGDDVTHRFLACDYFRAL